VTSSSGRLPKIPTDYPVDCCSCREPGLGTPVAHSHPPRGPAPRREQTRREAGAQSLGSSAKRDRRASEGMGKVKRGSSASRKTSMGLANRMRSIVCRLALATVALLVPMSFVSAEDAIPMLDQWASHIARGPLSGYSPAATNSMVRQGENAYSLDHRRPPQPIQQPAGQPRPRRRWA
jgi:hypothetical protein